MKEQELDRLREQIFGFRLPRNGSRQRSSNICRPRSREERRKAELEEVRECAQEQKYSDRKWMLTGVTGLIVMLTGIVLMVCCFSDNIFMTALLGILILLGLALTITSFLQLSRNQRSCHLAKRDLQPTRGRTAAVSEAEQAVEKAVGRGRSREKRTGAGSDSAKSFGKQQAMSWSSFQTERYWSSAGRGNGSGAGSFRIYVRAVRIIEKRYGSVSRNWIPMNSRKTCGTDGGSSGTGRKN